MILQSINDPHFHSIIVEIVKDISPAAIVCFGRSSFTSSHISCFQVRSSECYHHDLLVVRGESTQHSDHEISDLITNRFSGKDTVNVLSHSEAAVLSALQDQHPFFRKVFGEGVIVHQAEGHQFDAFHHTYGEQSFNNEKLERECGRAFELAQHFMSLASDAMGSGIHDVGVFLLHQAMEQMCMASIKAHLQYRPTTHSIVKLIALVSCYLPQAREFFPCNTNEERELMDFLKNAYSDVRYKTAYRMPHHTAFSLLERVSEFHHLLENTHTDFIRQA